MQLPKQRQGAYRFFLIIINHSQRVVFLWSLMPFFKQTDSSGTLGLSMRLEQKK